MFPDRKKDRYPLLQQNIYELWCEKQLFERQGLFLLGMRRLIRAHINNWSFLKWHSSTPGERKTCNSTVEYVLKDMLETLHIEIELHYGNNVHECGQQVSLLCPFSNILNRWWPRENAQGLCIFFLSSSLCWKHK